MLVSQRDCVICATFPMVHRKFAYSCAMSNRQDASRASAGVQSVDRAVNVLEILAHPGEAGVSDVAADIGVHKSTAFRLLAALEERELVEQTQERGKYCLGFGILRLASAVAGRLDVTQQGHPVCEQLAARLGETVNVALRRSHFVVNLDQAHGPTAVGAHNWVGELTPLRATSSGKILLAFMTPDHRREAVGHRGTQPAHPAHDHLARAARRADRGRRARRIRLLGEELEDGLNTIAAPIRDHTGQVIAALSVSGPVYRFTRQRLDEVAPDVIAAAAAIIHRMGHLD